MPYCDTDPNACPEGDFEFENDNGMCGWGNWFCFAQTGDEIDAPECPFEEDGDCLMDTGFDAPIGGTPPSRVAAMVAMRNARNGGDSCPDDGADDPDCGPVGAGVAPAIRSVIRDKRTGDLSLAQTTYGIDRPKVIRSAIKDKRTGDLSLA